MEVSASVYYMASVTQALSREFDSKIKTKTQLIEGLRNRLLKAQAASAAEVTKLRTELAALQDDVVEQLATRDAELARQVAAFRKDVQSISDTPEGFEALRLFNEGKWRAADAIFARIVAAVDRAEELASAMRRAAPRRQRARLAFEARERGLATTKEVTALFEEVTRLDQGNGDDWDALLRLYGDEGRYDDAVMASWHMLKTSADPFDAALRSAVAADLLAKREPAAAERVYTLIVEFIRMVAKAVTGADWLLGTMLDRLGVMQLSEGKYSAAEKSLEEALPLLRREGGEVSTRVRELRLSRALYSLAAVFQLQGQSAKAEEPLLEAVAICKRLDLQDPTRIDVQMSLNGLYFQLSVVAETKGELARSLDYLKHGLAIDRRLVASDGSYTNRKNLSETLYFVALASLRTSQNAEAELALTESAAVARALVQAQPHPEVRERLADNALLLSRLAFQQGDLEKAETLAREAVDQQRQLATDRPKNSNLAPALAALGVALDRKSAFSAALPVLEEAIELLSKGDGDNVQMEYDVVGAYRSVLYGLGRAGEGLDVVERSVANMRRLATASPDNVGLQMYVIGTEWRLGYLQLARREFGPTRATFNRIATLVNQQADAGVRSRMNAGISVVQGDLERLQNHSSAAIPHYEEAVRLYVEAKGANPKDPGDLFDLLEPKFRIAQLKADQASLAEITATYRKFGGRRGVHQWAASWIDDLDAAANQER